MSKSHHTTWNDLKGKTKIEIQGMSKDPDSLLNNMVKKRRVKKTVKADRKANKARIKNEL